MQLCQLLVENAAPSAGKTIRQLSAFCEKLPEDGAPAIRFCSFFPKVAASGSDLLHCDLLLAAQRDELLRHPVISDYRLHLLQHAVGKQRRFPVFGRIDQQIGLLTARDRRALDLIFLPVGNAETACGRQRRNAKKSLIMLKTAQIFDGTVVRIS